MGEIVCSSVRMAIRKKIELTYVSLNNTGLASLGLQQSILCILSDITITYNSPFISYILTAFCGNSYQCKKFLLLKVNVFF